jgi:hypothetical protein
MSIYETNIAGKILEGIFDDAVIARAKILLENGDMDYDFLCDDCDRGDCNDCQKEPQINEGYED